MSFNKEELGRLADAIIKANKKDGGLTKLCEALSRDDEGYVRGYLSGQIRKFVHGALRGIMEVDDLGEKTNQVVEELRQRLTVST